LHSFLQKVGCRPPDGIVGNLLLLSAFSSPDYTFYADFTDFTGYAYQRRQSVDMFFGVNFWQKCQKVVNTSAFLT
jgi:hypothetical protein